MAVPQVLSLHMFLQFSIHHRKSRATSSADTADSCCCTGSSLRTSNWPVLHRQRLPRPFFSKL